MNAHNSSKLNNHSITVTDELISSQQQQHPVVVVPGRIGVHCLAGLGRAPVLVAIALIHYGSSPENAIALVRRHRPGAINHS
jgi:protein tyrosine phosphatase type 4A